MRFRLRLEGRSYEIAGGTWTVDGEPVEGPLPSVEILSHTAARIDGVRVEYAIEDLVAEGEGAGGSAGPVRAPMTGRLVSVAAEGTIVEAGETVFILEAMKMQNAVKAPIKGTIVRVAAEAGEALQAGQVVVELE